MKVLVTGSEGYIGIVLVQMLMERGHDVTGLDTGYYRSGWFYNGVKKLPLVLSKDVRDVTLEDVKGFDAIIHLAELSNDPLSQNNPEITFDINHRGTVELARKAKEAGVKRFIYSSSCSVYGASEVISDEMSPTNPITAYAKSKVLNEQALLALADKNFSPVILRNATVFGPSPRMRFDLVVNNLAGLAFTTKEIKMDSDGKPWRPFVHVKDVSNAYICALEASLETVHKQIFNVGDTHGNYQIKDIAHIIATVFPGCKVSLNKNGADKRNYKVSFEKINTKLPGFKCLRTVKDGAEELLEIFKSIDLKKEDFESRNYTRLKNIQYLKDTQQLNERFFWRNNDI